MPAHSVSCVTILVLTAACMTCDLRTGKIPNSLILCGIACAAFSRCSMAFHAGIPRAGVVFADGAAGMIVPFILLGALAALKMMGGGDVKLLSVAGLQFGTGGGLKIIGYSIVFAAVCSVYLVIRRRNLAVRLNCFRRYLGESIRGGRAGPYRQDKGDRSGEFCMAVPIYAALIVYCISANTC